MYWSAVGLVFALGMLTGVGVHFNQHFLCKPVDSCLRCVRNKVCCWCGCADDADGADIVAQMVMAGTNRDHSLSTIPTRVRSRSYSLARNKPFLQTRCYIQCIDALIGIRADDVGFKGPLFHAAFVLGTTVVVWFYIVYCDVIASSDLSYGTIMDLSYVKNNHEFVEVQRWSAVQTALIVFLSIFFCAETYTNYQRYYSSWVCSEFKETTQCQTMFRFSWFALLFVVYYMAQWWLIYWLWPFAAILHYCGNYYSIHSFTDMLIQQYIVISECVDDFTLTALVTPLYQMRSASLRSAFLSTATIAIMNGVCYTPHSIIVALPLLTLWVWTSMFNFVRTRQCVYGWFYGCPGCALPPLDNPYDNDDGDNGNGSANVTTEDTTATATGTAFRHHSSHSADLAMATSTEMSTEVSITITSVSRPRQSSVPPQPSYISDFEDSRKPPNDNSDSDYDDSDDNSAVIIFKDIHTRHRSHTLTLPNEKGKVDYLPRQYTPRQDPHGYSSQPKAKRRRNQPPRPQTTTAVDRKGKSAFNFPTETGDPSSAQYPAPKRRKKKKKSRHKNKGSKTPLPTVSTAQPPLSAHPTRPHSQSVYDDSIPSQPTDKRAPHRQRGVMSTNAYDSRKAFSFDDEASPPVASVPPKKHRKERKRPHTTRERGGPTAVTMSGSERSLPQRSNAAPHKSAEKKTRKKKKRRKQQQQRRGSSQAYGEKEKETKPVPITMHGREPSRTLTQGSTYLEDGNIPPPPVNDGSTHNLLHNINASDRSLNSVRTTNPTPHRRPASKRRKRRKASKGGQKRMSKDDISIDYNAVMQQTAQRRHKQQKTKPRHTNANGNANGSNPKKASSSRHVTIAMDPPTPSQFQTQPQLHSQSKPNLRSHSKRKNKSGKHKNKGKKAVTFGIDVDTTDHTTTRRQPPRQYAQTPTMDRTAVLQQLYNAPSFISQINFFAPSHRRVNTHGSTPSSEADTYASSDNGSQRSVIPNLVDLVPQMQSKTRLKTVRPLPLADETKKRRAPTTQTLSNTSPRTKRNQRYASMDRFTKGGMSIMQQMMANGMASRRDLHNFELAHTQFQQSTRSLYRRNVRNNSHPQSEPILTTNPKT